MVTAEVGGDETGECELHHGHRSGLWGMDSARAPMWPDKTFSLIVERQGPMLNPFVRVILFIPRSTLREGVSPLYSWQNRSIRLSHLAWVTEAETKSGHSIRWRSPPPDSVAFLLPTSSEHLSLISVLFCRRCPAFSDPGFVCGRLKLSHPQGI